MRNILFYKFVKIKEPEELVKELRELCEDLGLKGKVLLAHEGINGCLSGTDAGTKEFMAALRGYPEFNDIDFKKGKTTEHNFRKLIVRTKQEIITSRFEFDIDNKASYIEPEELKELLDKGGEVMIIDARNSYESDMGKFEGAVVSDIARFSEWPEAVEDMEELKDKPIVTYCTGGIRCEKAGAYMKEQGFRNVRQLRGGILNYASKYGSEHWEGKCFVFDKRIAVNLNEEKPAPNADPDMWNIGYSL